jgi:cobalt-zinc-cadmium efflux system protein
VSLAEVQQRMLAVPGVSAVHDLHVWAVTSGMVAMSGHAVVPDLVAHPGVLEGIRTELATLGIGHVTVQLEVSREGCDGCDDARTAAGVPDRAASAGHAEHRYLGHHH